jgi:Phosphoribosylformylglycinamidine (FGAM) synthase, glutamine amidotransferase domain
MSIGVVIFPGSNCDRDVRWATEGCLGLPTRFLWHEDQDLSGLDAVVLPGGFSYGDYLRCGAIARFAPVLQHWSTSPPMVGGCWASAMAFSADRSWACCPVL